MTQTSLIRETSPGDLPQLLDLYPKAFPNEDLRPLVSGLLQTPVETLSLATFDGETLVAHLLFTLSGPANHPPTAAMLAPLGVLPTHQRQGLGRALVSDGLQRLAAMSIRQVFVLGDPAYYKRFGFAPERQVQPPYPMPPKWANAWQSLCLANRPPLPAGPLALPDQWLDPALWLP